MHNRLQADGGSCGRLQNAKRKTAKITHRDFSTTGARIVRSQFQGS
jgi:hypothetical protein